MIYGRFFRVALTVAVTLCASPALAQNGAPVGEPAATVEQARKMIFSGDPAGALDMLRPLAERHPENTDIYFFRGMAAAAVASLPDGRPGAPADRDVRRALRDEAVDSYRHIVSRRPDLAGARLELARVLFERGRCLAEPDDLLIHLLGDDCDAAAYHFRRALAGELPEQVTAAVSRFLAVIQARKRVSGSFGMSIAPDTNINAGTSARTFIYRIFGVPLEFELNEQSRKTSGVGVVVSAAGGYRHPVELFDSAATRLRLDGSVYRREHGGQRFDDMTVAVDGGLQFLFPRARASLLAKVDRRWFAGDPLSRGFGPRVEGGIRIGNRVWLRGGVERMERRYRRGTNNNGPRLDLDLGLNYALTPAVALGMRGGWQRSRTKSQTLRSVTRRLGVYGVVDLPPIFDVRGFEIGLFHDVYFTRHKQRYLRIARRDRLSASRVTASNDNLELFGFVPALSVVHERRETNIQRIFDYRRIRGELTFRRLF